MRRFFLLVLLAAVGPWAGAQETTRFFPVTASAPGENGTYFKTDARVFNPDATTAITVMLAYLPPNADNSGASEVAVVIQPRQAAALDDLVATVFQVTGSGGVRLRSNRPFLATSRTYNVGDGTSGTFGQFIPGLSPDQALTQGLLLQVVNDPAVSGFRSNIGFLNPGSSPVTVEYSVYDAGSATLLGEGSRTLAALGFFQVNNVFNVVGEGQTVVRNATVELIAPSAVLAYASVVDNTSGDAVFVLPYADTGTPVQANNPPEGTIVTPAADVVATVGESVSFAASVSDPDGDAVTGLEWDFGDGITASGLEVVHTYTEAGSYGVTFTASDSRGLTDPTPATRGVTVTAASATLTQVQQEVFSASCAFAGCHAGSSPAQGMNLITGQAHANIVNVASHEQPTLDRVEPGDPDQSYLWRKVNGGPSISGQRMPLGGPVLGQEQLDLLRSWILAGAPND